MTFKEQLKKIKDNWLIALVIIVLFMIFVGGGLISSLSSGINSVSESMGSGSYKGGVYYDSVGVEAEYARDTSMAPSSMPFYDQGIASDVKERLVVKTADIETEVKRGQFNEADSMVNSIIKSSDSIILNQNVNKYESGIKEYYTGYYTIKVDVKKYDSVIEQLKKIGEINSFDQNQYDVTEEHQDLQIEIEAEKQRLERYNKMYDEAKEVKDKIELSDRIFNQERVIKYMEESLKSTEERVEYSTINLKVTEKRSEYAGIVFIKISELVAGFVASLGGLLALVVILIPWGLAAWLIIWIIIRIRKRKPRK
jgi:hypothetical protein